MAAASSCAGSCSCQEFETSSSSDAGPPSSSSAKNSGGETPPSQPSSSIPARLVFEVALTGNVGRGPLAADGTNNAMRVKTHRAKSPPRQGVRGIAATSRSASVGCAYPLGQALPHASPLKQAAGAGRECVRSQIPSGLRISREISDCARRWREALVPRDSRMAGLSRVVAGETLGVSLTASDEGIRHAFVHLALDSHPRASGDAAAFRKVAPLPNA